MATAVGTHAVDKSSSNLNIASTPPKRVKIDCPREARLVCLYSQTSCKGPKTISTRGTWAPEGSSQATKTSETPAYRVRLANDLVLDVGPVHVDEM